MNMLTVGVQRIFLAFMLAAAPLAYSEPISIYQEALPVRSGRVAAKEQVKIKARKITRPIPKQKLSVKKIQKKKFPRMARPSIKKGIASWYSKADDFINKHTANGEVFNDRAMTCASWYHPFGTKLKVTNLQNGKSVVCRVNDRGPNKRLRREIDLTIGAFKKIASAQRGLIRVSIVKQPGKPS